MPTLKKLINQMEHNDPYIIKINEIIQTDERTSRILRELRNSIDFEASFNDYKVITKSKITYGPHPDFYQFTITKKDKELLKGIITPVNKIQKFTVTFTYDFNKDLVELNDNIVQLFEDAI